MSQIPLERYLHTTDSVGATFSPDGRHLYFLNNTTGHNQLWRTNAQASTLEWPEQMTFESERVMECVLPDSGDDSRFAFAVDQGGSELFQLKLGCATSGRQCLLTAGFESRKHGLVHWDARRELLFFTANHRDESLFDVHVLDTSGLLRAECPGPARLLHAVSEPGYVTSSAYDRQRGVLFLAFEHTSSHASLWALPLSGQGRKLLDTDDGNITSVQVRESDGRLFAVVCDHADFPSVVSFSPDGGEACTVAALSQEVDAAHLTADGQRMLLALNDNGCLKLAEVALATGELAPLPLPDPLRNAVLATPGVSTLWSLSPDGSSLAFSLSSFRTPWVLVRYDLEGGTATFLSRPGTGGVPTRLNRLPDHQTLRSFDGLEFSTFLMSPAHGTAERLPCIVVVHGGPESQVRPWYAPLYQWFADNGFLVAFPNVRGSTGYGTRFRDADNVRKRMDSVADLNALGEWLQRHPRVDAKRMAVMGGSYGGFMVLSALHTRPDLWAAGVDTVGIANFVTFLERTSGYRRAHREHEYGSLAHDRDFLREISPLTHVERMTAPLFIAHGANDPRVPLHEAEQVAAAYERRGLKHRLQVYPDEGHGIFKLRNRLDLYPKVVAFLREAFEAR